jgi:hypothetical protein
MLRNVAAQLVDRDQSVMEELIRRNYALDDWISSAQICDGSEGRRGR